MFKHTQTIPSLLPKNCLSMFDHFVGLALKKLNMAKLFLCQTILFSCNKKINFFTVQDFCFILYLCYFPCSITDIYSSVEYNVGRRAIFLMKTTPHKAGSFVTPIYWYFHLWKKLTWPKKMYLYYTKFKTFTVTRWFQRPFLEYCKITLND